MKNEIEVLSPVGDINGFFASINSGCDAVYFGLPKFNARMKADNISIENLSDLVRFAHLKNVRVYITMNTLLSDSELIEAVSLAGECLQAHVDGFIVQDLGLIKMLKSVYPNIVLHGSTQLGVHNVEGALTAKKLGLSRVVLSRECTLSDIAEISKNVDIELEVFVQGANCICFSGNCYISSLKCGASGNRGECRQLCRLPYTLSDGHKSLSGFTLSPKDNCMLEYIEKLQDLGVKSIKIEGRLRQIGYTKVATSIYRDIVDAIASKQNQKSSNNSTNSKLDFDFATAKQNLAKVFSRGEFTAGYNQTNNIIDHMHNNHMGEKIGSVCAVTKFKDLYKISINSHKQLHTGDGIKFEYNNNVISAGVGNVETNGKNQIVFVKNKVDVASTVYLANDTDFTNAVPDKSKYRDLEISFVGIAGKPIVCKFKCGNYIAEYTGDIVESAKSRPITSENIISQLSKVDPKIWKVADIKIETENAFIPLSLLNEIRRQNILNLEKQILESMEVPFAKCETRKYDFNFCKQNLRKTYENLIIVDEKDNLNFDKSDFDVVVLSPSEYNLQTIKTFKAKHDQKFKTPLVINLRSIARTTDMPIITEIINAFASNKNETSNKNESKLQSNDNKNNLQSDAFKDNLQSDNSKNSLQTDGTNEVIFLINNIYGLYFSDKANIWCGAYMNITNQMSAKCVLEMGAKEIVGIIEKWTSRLENTYKCSGLPLMTITSCPVKLLYSNDCANCKYNDQMKYSGTLGEFKIKRFKIKNCYFELYDLKERK